RHLSAGDQLRRKIPGRDFSRIFSLRPAGPSFISALSPDIATGGQFFAQPLPAASRVQCLDWLCTYFAGLVVKTPLWDWHGSNPHPQAPLVKRSRLSKSTWILSLLITAVTLIPQAGGQSK